MSKNSALSEVRLSDFFQTPYTLLDERSKKTLLTNQSRLKLTDNFSLNNPSFKQFFVLSEANPSILYGNINIDLYLSEYAKEKQTRDLIVAPHTIFNAGLFPITIRYSAWRSKLQYRPVSNTNWIFDDDSIREISLTDFDSSHTKQSFGFRRISNTPLTNNNIIEIFPKNTEPLIIARPEISILTAVNCFRIIRLAEETIAEMKKFYRQDAANVKNEDLIILDQSLEFALSNLKYILSNYSPDSFNENGEIISNSVIEKILLDDTNASQSTESKEKVKSYNENALKVIKDYKSYSIDLVKMMSRPLMCDLSIPEIIDLDTMCEDISLKISDEEIITRSEYLELNSLYKKAYNMAETKKLTTLDKDKQTKIRDASQMLQKAMHQNTEEHEKRLSVKGLLINLNGILPVGDESLYWLTHATGLAELER